MKINNYRASQTILLFTILTISGLIYYQGIYGCFLMDDFGTLPKLGNDNGIKDIGSLIRFILGGATGPTGRPISLLSFLIDANNWPTNPLPFKRTNIIIHLITSTLLFFVSQNIFKTLISDNTKTLYASIIATSLWLLNPFQVSTVLYVVQRMAMLATIFVILGLLLYTYGRHLLSSNKRKAYFYLSFSVIACTVLATLSKENGALLPLLLLVVEFIIFLHPKSSTAKLNKLWMIFFLVIPSILIASYLTTQLFKLDLHNIITHRNFSIYQRSLTETRIIIEYLYHLLIPQMFYRGLFVEDFPISTGLLSPITTLPSVILALSLPILSVAIRKKFPFIALAILFYFSAHLMETFTIPLELYFEHRNYLPSLLLFLPIGQLFVYSNRPYIKAFVLLYLLTNSMFTFQRVSLWGNPYALVQFWGKQNTFSRRAQRTAAMTLDINGRSKEALQILEKAKKNIPHSLAVKLHWLQQKCKMNVLTENDIHDVIQDAQWQRYSTRLYHLLDSVITHSIDENCKEFDPKHALLLLDNLLVNPSITKENSMIFQIKHLKGKVYANNDEAKLAELEFESALALSKDAEVGLAQVAILASNRHYKEALMHLNKTDKVINNLSEKFDIRDYFKHFDYEAKILRQRITEDSNRAKLSIANKDSINE